MNWLLRNCRVVGWADSKSKSGEERLDVRVTDGRIAEIAPRLAERGDPVLDIAGKILTAGLVDIHVHFREPGHEYKEDIESGSRTAVAGGFTTVCCMPNTKPVNDCRTVTDLIVSRSREVGLCRVLPIGAISQKLEGNSLAEFAEMREAGIVAVSDDGRPIMHAGLMRRALEYAKTFDLPVIQHAEDLHLAEGGVMNEGVTSVRLGLRGQPAQAESVMVARDIELVELTGARYHVAHVSTARTVALVREAKQRGLPVTCEVAPHHFTLTEQAVGQYDTNAKVAPPLRSSVDVAAIREGLADGTIDCIATDHAPHSPVEKDVEFDHAACGMVGLETAVALTLALVRQGVVSLEKAVALLTSNPARILKLDACGIGQISVGGPADLTVWDVDKQWVVKSAEFASKSHNSPFEGMAMQGWADLTMFGGKVVFSRHH